MTTHPSETTPLNQETAEILSRCRAQICLNGVWAIHPADSAPSSENGRQAQLPSRWPDQQPWAAPPQITCLDGPAPNGPAWLRCQTSIPAAWNGRVIHLETRRYCPEGAQVYINGQDCGAWSWETGCVEITNAVQPGQPVEIVLLAADPHQLLGDLFLTSRPAGATISDVFVRTSTRRGEISLDVEISGIVQPGPVVFTARVFPLPIQSASESLLIPSPIAATATPECTFTATASLTAAPVQTIHITWPWPDARRWDIGQPNRYRLLLDARAPGLDDEYAQDFGFREFWIEGRKFFLNGSEIRLRPVLCGAGDVLEQIDGTLEGYRWAGYNLVEIWPDDQPDGNRQLWYEAADRQGIGITGLAGHIWRWLPTWGEPDTHAAYERRSQVELRRLRNHPSILMWGTNANTIGSGINMDPRHLGRRDDPWYAAAYHRSGRVQPAEQAMAILKKHDPTRPVFFHHAGGLGDVYTVNMYLNLMPLQEREEWLSAWAQDGEMPFMVVEFGTPLHVSFHRGRTDFGEARCTEPWLTEFAAIYLGRRAYELETPGYRTEIAARFRGGQQYEFWQLNPHIDFAPALQEIERLYIANTWRSWRTMGITGGMIPWTDGHGWGAGPQSEQPVPLPAFVSGRRGAYTPSITRQQRYGFHPEGSQVYPAGWALRENNAATLTWICGPREGFPAKDHHFLAGQNVCKQIALLNDTRQPQPYAIHWQASLNAEGGISQVIALGNISGQLAPGQTGFEPLEFSLPAQGNTRRDGLIELTATIGENGDVDTHGDTFRFRVYAATQHQDAKSLRIITEPCDLAEHEAFVRDGGQLLINTQDRPWLESLGFRLTQPVARRFFPVLGNPLPDFDAEDFRDWQGESAAVEPYPAYEPGTTRLGKWWFPYHGYRWGTRGAVSAAAIEKPHRAGWTPWLEGEFDLAYTPLMSLDYGRGRVTICALEPSADPAAQQFHAELITALQSEPPLPRAQKVVLLGNDDDARWLDRLNVSYTRAEGSLPRATDLLLVGHVSDDVEAILQDFAFCGRRVFCLPRRGPKAPFGVTLRHEPACAGSLEVPAWAEGRGLSASDLHARAGFPAWLVASGAEIAANGLLGRMAIGSGTILFCQLDPDQLEADNQTYLRFTRWRQTRAIVQILANLGASFHCDGDIFHPRPQQSLSLAGPWLAARGPETPSRAWHMVELPQPWEKLGPEWCNFAEDIILRRAVNIPAEWAGYDLLLSLGKVDNSDCTYFNGQCVSDLEAKPEWPHNFPRVYRIPANYSHPGENDLLIQIYERQRLYDMLWKGGFCGLPEELWLRPMPHVSDPGLYHPDFRQDYVLGDDPYRYFNW
jgi:beta-galactosidase